MKPLLRCYDFKQEKPISRCSILKNWLTGCWVVNTEVFSISLPQLPASAVATFSGKINAETGIERALPEEDGKLRGLRVRKEGKWWLKTERGNVGKRDGGDNCLVLFVPILV